MKNKKLIIVLSIIAILVLTIGVSFAFFTYNKVSINNSSLVVGDIYMHYNETNEFKIEGDFYTIVGLPLNKLYNILKKIDE